MLFSNFDGRKPPFGKFFRPLIADVDIGLDQPQLRDDFRVMPQEVEQPDQHQLRIRVWIDP
jgi:hypothetical protein